MRLIIGSCQVLLASLISLPGCGKTNDRPSGPPARELEADWGPPLNQPAPEINGQDTEGKGFKLSAARGKVVLLSFWGHF